MSETLKPCPFCGGEVGLFFYEGMHYTHCFKCSASVCFSVMTQTPEQAVAAWNARAERTCHAVERMASASGITYFECDGCGAHLPNDIAGHYCWKCGARVEVGE